MDSSVLGLSHSISSEKKESVNNSKSGFPSDDSDDSSSDSDRSESSPSAKKGRGRPKLAKPAAPKAPPSFKAPPPRAPEAPKSAAKKSTPTPSPIPKDEKSENIRKITEYYSKECFQHFFTEKEVKDWNPDAAQNYSEDKINKIISSIKIKINSTFRVAATESLFSALCNFSEQAMVNFLQMEHMNKFSSFAQANRALVEPELAEIAIEMSDDLIPGAKWRLGMKVMVLMNQYSEMKKMTGAVPSDPLSKN